MNVTFERINPARPSADLVAVVVRPADLKEGKKGAKKGAAAAEESSFQQLNRAHKGALARTLHSAGFSAKGSSSLLFRDPLGGALKNVLVLAATYDEKQPLARLEGVRGIAARIADTAAAVKARSVGVLGLERELDGDGARAFIEGALLSRYTFDLYRSGKKENRSAAKITCAVTAKPPAAAVRRARATASAVIRAKDLINLAPNDLRPGELVRRIKQAARESGLECMIVDGKKLAKLGAGSLLCVAQGSTEPGYLAVLRYRPAGRTKNGKRITALVGKGVTFDSGGLSIKPAGGMETMKCDMSGAAAVLAAMTALKEIGVEREIRGYIPIVENMVSGDSVRPGDVVRSLSGKTIEVLNTDAEGRLILADALTYASREKPDEIIDLATLTGAIGVALGNRFAGLFSNSDRLAAELIDSGSSAGERYWRLPLPDEYKHVLKSPVADLKNSFGREGGSITAALFLQEFVGEKIDWAHLDIAATAFLGGDEGYIKKGGVGFGVRTLLDYLSRA